MKNKFIITGLATATLLSTAALSNFVGAEGTDAKAELTTALTTVEKDAETAIKANDKIEDKDKAIVEYKEYVGKEDLLKSIEAGEITADEAIAELPEGDSAVTPLGDHKLSDADLAKIKDAEAKEAARPEAEKTEEAIKDIDTKIEKLIKASEGLTGDDAKAYAEEISALKVDRNALSEKAEDSAVEALQNKVADLEKEVASLEDELKGLGEVEDYVREGFETTLAAKKAELAKAEEELEAALQKLEPAASNGDALVNDVTEFTGSVRGDAPATNDVPEFGAHNPEIKKILKEMEEIQAQIKSGEENGAEPYYLDGLKSRLADLQDALDILINNKPAVHEVPEYRDGETPVQEPAEQPADQNGQTTVATGDQAANTATSVATSTDNGGKQLPELPNTGTAEMSVFTPAVLSILAGLGLAAPKFKKEN